eukprot:265845_1
MGNPKFDNLQSLAYFAFHLFDFLTDFTLSLQWIEGYTTYHYCDWIHETNAKLKPIGFILLISAVIGAILGVINTSYWVFVSYKTQSSSTAVEMQTHTVQSADQTQTATETAVHDEAANEPPKVYNIWYFLPIVKLIIEDLIAVILITVVSSMYEGVPNAYVPGYFANPFTAWCLSIVSMFLAGVYYFIIAPCWAIQWKARNCKCKMCFCNCLGLVVLILILLVLFAINQALVSTRLAIVNDECQVFTFTENKGSQGRNLFETVFDDIGEFENYSMNAVFEKLVDKCTFSLVSSSNEDNELQLVMVDGVQQCANLTYSTDVFTVCFENMFKP